MGIFNVSANSREAISLTPIQAALVDRLCKLVEGLPSAKRHSLAKHMKGLKSDEESCETTDEEVREESEGTGETGFEEAPQCVDTSN